MSQLREHLLRSMLLLGINLQGESMLLVCANHSAFDLWKSCPGCQGRKDNADEQKAHDVSDPSKGIASLVQARQACGIMVFRFHLGFCNLAFDRRC